MKRALVSTAAVFLLLTGCSAPQGHEDARGRGDAPVAQEAGHGGDDSPGFCTNMPDGFGNVCGKCLHRFPPYAVAVTTNTDYAPSNVVLFQAPEQCGGKAVGGVPPMTSSAIAVKPPEDES